MIIQSHIVIISVCIIKYNSEISITPHQLLASIKTSSSSTSTLYLKHKTNYQRIVIILNYLTQLNEIMITVTITALISLKCLVLIPIFKRQHRLYPIYRNIILHNNN